MFIKKHLFWPSKYYNYFVFSLWEVSQFVLFWQRILLERIMPRVLSINKIEGQRCADEIGWFKHDIDRRFGMEPDAELYIELEQDQICMLLYTIFGSFDLLQGDKKFTKLTSNTRDKIHNIFKSISSLKHKNGEFINRFRLHYTSVCINMQLLEEENSIWKRIAPRALVQSYENVYFGYLIDLFRLTQFDQRWQSPQRQEINKKVLVVPFKNGNKIILGFYQTKRSFSVAQINETLKRQVLFRQQKKSEIKIPHKIQEKLELKLQNQKEIMVAVQDNNKKVKIPKFYQEVPFKTIYIAFIIFLTVMVFHTYFNPSNIEIHVPNTSNSFVFKEGLFQYEKEQIDKFIEYYKVKVVKQWEQLPHYFSNPLHNTTVEINIKHPEVAGSVSKFIQESQPIHQMGLQQIVL